MTDLPAHTLSSFDGDLDRLRGLVVRMGRLCEAQIIAAADALARHDAAAARTIVDGDSEIDALEAETEAFAIQTIALRAPMAGDLREIVAALKISGILERIGDYAKNIAKRTTVLAKDAPMEPMVLVPEMARMVAQMVHGAIDAYVARDAVQAAAIAERDQLVDDFYTSLFRSLLTFMMENPQRITPSAHLLFIAKSLERVGDHATNIAELVSYSATGERMGERTKRDDTAMVTTPHG
ncbi:phosphate signaling complex protein PhoU [Sandarakinorhabdus sp. DWP1-3-1]|uniref:phosphate signaling complex protein PhoU n=1 Tax=Sandarakinorhabdus sp. DWP1-3-1 TaxID=2804627 RepID=UPI003CFBADDE